MGLLSYPFKAYVRWRHSRGFGVHSPFAYSLVDMAIRPGKYGYYGYEEIDRVVLAPDYKGYPQSRHDSRLLLRLLVQLQSLRLILPEGLPAMCAAARGAGIDHLCFGTLPPSRPGDFLVATPGSISDDELSSRLTEGTTILLLSPSESSVKTIYSVCQTLPGGYHPAADRGKGHGLILHGTRLLLAIPHPEMAFTSYTMKF